MSRVNIFLKCRLKIPVTYFEVEWRVERRKHKSRFSEIKRKNKGTRRRNAARKRNPWTLASLLLRAVRNTCMGDKYKHEHIKLPQRVFPTDIIQISHYKEIIRYTLFFFSLLFQEHVEIGDSNLWPLSWDFESIYLNSLTSWAMLR